VLASFFQQRDDLFALHAWKPLEKLLDRIARLQVVEKTFYRNTGPNKNRLATENIRILRYDFAHELQLNLKQMNVPAGVDLNLCDQRTEPAGSVRRGAQRITSSNHSQSRRTAEAQLPNPPQFKTRSLPVLSRSSPAHLLCRSSHSLW
jgi:hypothetical protein